MKDKSKGVVSYFMIVVGALLASFSVAAILLPNDAIDYGTAGIAIIISKLTGFNLSITVIAVFVPFLIFGGIVLGKSFFFRALVGSTVYTVGLEVFEKLSVEINTEHFLAVAFGGAILGFGLALILRAGGCIDGSEILANMFVSYLSSKTSKNFSLMGFLVVFNICVYLAAYILINPNSALLSILVYIVSTIVVDHFTDRFDAIKQVTMITKNPDEIIKRIRFDMKKTCTTWNSSGAIAGDNKTVICYVNYLELQKLRDIIKSVDDTTFVTVSTIDETFIS